MLCLDHDLWLDDLGILGMALGKVHVGVEGSIGPVLPVHESMIDLIALRSPMRKNPF